MIRTPSPPTPGRRRGAPALLAGLILLGAVGSCQLPAPKIPSVGSLPGLQPASMPVLQPASVGAIRAS